MRPIVTGSIATDYLMVSFHPEAEEIEDLFFARLDRLKQAGHSVIFRFVGHPARLHRLDALSEKCRELDIAFYPTPLFSPDYPAAYTAEERRAIRRHFASLSQVIQMENGIDTSSTRCWAGSRLIAIDMRTGNITPCISVLGPILGNIYEDRLESYSSTIACPSPGIGCSCDVHFQQDTIPGAEDRARFERLKAGHVQPVSEAELAAGFDSAHLRFSKATPGIGQTATAGQLVLTTQQVKDVYDRTQDFLTGAYAASNHPEFKRRQFS